MCCRTGCCWRARSDKSSALTTTVQSNFLSNERPLAVISYLICEPPPYACPEPPLGCVVWTSRVRAPNQFAGLHPSQSSCSALGMNQYPVSHWLAHPLVSEQRSPRGPFHRNDQC